MAHARRLYARSRRWWKDVAPVTLSRVSALDVLAPPVLLLGHLRRLCSWVRKSWPGEDPAKHSRCAAVYAHFDRRGVIHDYVLHQLQELVSAGFRIIFVTNSPIFRPSSASEIAPYCQQILWRHNVGYDFGAYKEGIRAIGDLDAIDRLLLMNDSVYGPLYPLSEVLASVDATQTDLWGITDSWEHHYHIQSYFILFLKGALQSPAFRRFWRRLPYFNSKYWNIRYGEIRLTQVLTQRKLRAIVLNPYWNTANAALRRLQSASREGPPEYQAFLDKLQGLLVLGRPLNQSHYFFETLLTDFRCPFIKRELIADNPVKMPYSWRWAELIAHCSDYDSNLIYRHLQAN